MINNSKIKYLRNILLGILMWIVVFAVMIGIYWLSVNLITELA